MGEKEEFKPVILNFERIDLSDVMNKPSCFLDNDRIIENSESNLDEYEPTEEDKELFVKIMTKHQNNFRL